jgi:hypothetical protein
VEAVMQVQSIEEVVVVEQLRPQERLAAQADLVLLFLDFQLVLGQLRLVQV